MCTNNIGDPFGVDPIGGALFKNSPEGAMINDAVETGNFLKPYGDDKSGLDVLGAGPGAQITSGGKTAPGQLDPNDASDRQIGRTIGTIMALYFGSAALANAGAAPAAAPAGGAAGGTGITAGAAGAAGITPGAAGAVGITPAAGAGATMGLGAATVAGAAAVPAAEAAPAAAAPAAAAPAAETVFTMKNAATALSVMSSLAPLLAGKPDDAPSALAAPTAPPAPGDLLSPGAKPTGQQKARKKLGDPTALTGPGGIPFDSLTLGRATILGG